MNYTQLLRSTKTKEVARIIADYVYMTFGVSVQVQDSTEYDGYRLFIDPGGISHERVIYICGFAEGVFCLARQIHRGES